MYKGDYFVKPQKKLKRNKFTEAVLLKKLGKEKMLTLFCWVFLQKRNVREICIFQMISIIIFVIPNGQIRTLKE